ncbi:MULTISPECIES: LysR family transcriptional regulator [unclassified Duganella]|uniref:LysR family transcriptional regulator n=1 Tax=unclassified Duganella TaxID=2636909 RepID=UPI0006FA039D|nr:MULTISPECIES: LysR family transcriptional regulator [unclassified Duganella]KQV58017.1 transcriptional regulator [Duganella sp. Root336D2]KRB99132.1 transcriptional regulator [Duganella sp. Root198D2]
MDRLKAMQTFVRIVEANSYTKAAETLGLPRAALTATIQKLEAYLGTQLLQRTTRTLALTSDGTAYFRHCMAILAAVDEAEAPFRASENATPQGLLRVELGGAVGRKVVIPRLGEFCRAYPNVELVLNLSDRLADLVRDGVDCALRVGALQDSALIGRQIGTMRFVSCAAPSYLAAHGAPQSLEDLAQHKAILHYSGRTGRPFDWAFSASDGERKIDMPGTLATNDAEAYATLGLQGLGLVQTATYLVRDHLASGALVQVLHDTPPTPMPVSLVYPQGRMASPKLKVFARWLEALFDAEPDLRRDTSQSFVAGGED